MSREIFEMCNLQYLPLDKSEVTVHYEGSIDKTGYNSDWDWQLYKESDKNEWIIFECIGSGCIYNFVQHRYLKSTEVIFRFYFDDEPEPRFEIKPCEFGEKYPFLEPLASKYIARGNRESVIDDKNAIRVVRSFAPMPFAKSCKITSSLPLMGGRIPEGGWGHVIYHKYHKDFKTETFTPKNPEYHKLISLWSQTGRAPIKGSDIYSTFSLNNDEKKCIFKDDRGGLITGIRIRTDGFKAENLKDLILYAKWDNHSEYDVLANFGCVFSNEQGLNRTQYLLAGMDSDGEYYCYYPMPYAECAEIFLENTGESEINFELVSVSCTDKYNDLYRENKFGYFSSSPYYERKCTHGSDSIIAEVSGSGHIVSSIITGYGINDGASCEGDVRVHFNSIRTPQIESDGSESYACYGWGFESPVQCNPSSGYDGYIGEKNEPECWSMTRHLTGDWYPYRNGFRFGIESFDYNNKDMEHSGMIFYYNTGAAKEYEIAHIETGNSESETNGGYKRLDDISPITKTSYFEGDDDDKEVTFTGYIGGLGSEIDFDVKEGTKYVVIRRVCDQSKCRQLAAVYVNGEEVTEYPWYFPDSNPYKSWLEDEFIIPNKYICGKKHFTVKIVPCKCGGKVFFNEFEYTVYGIM